MTDAKVDVAIQAFGRPYQSALTLLSLSHYCSKNINKIFFIIECVKPKFETIEVTVLKDIVPNMETVLLQEWIGATVEDFSLLRETKYRQAVRYQYAFEHTTQDFMLILHNDINFTDNPIPKLLENIDNNIAVGELGQCWNCPASREHIVKKLNINNGIPCTPTTYRDFKLTFSDLDTMYHLVKANKEHYRDFLKGPWAVEFQKKPWPLPECRINEWCCIINMQLAKKTTIPVGNARPIGLSASRADTGVAWFRDVHHMGYHAKHVSINNYYEHRSGYTNLWYPEKYEEAEQRAKSILLQSYPRKCRELADRGIII